MSFLRNLFAAPEEERTLQTPRPISTHTIPHVAAPAAAAIDPAVLQELLRMAQQRPVLVTEDEPEQEERPELSSREKEVLDQSKSVEKLFYLLNTPSISVRSKTHDDILILLGLFFVGCKTIYFLPPSDL